MTFDCPFDIFNSFIHQNILDIMGEEIDKFKAIMDNSYSYLFYINILSLYKKKRYLFNK